MNKLTPKILTESPKEGELYVTVGGYGDERADDPAANKRPRIIKIEQVGDLHLAADTSFIDPTWRVKGQMVAEPYVTVFYTEDGRTQDSPTFAPLALADRYTPEKYPDAF